MRWTSGAQANQDCWLNPVIKASGLCDMCSFMLSTLLAAVPTAGYISEQRAW